MIDYAKLAIIISVVLAIFGSGFWVGNSRYTRYKAEVEIIAKTQEAHVESIQKQHELIKKAADEEYTAKLALLRQYYANGVRQPSSNSLSGLSTTASIANATTAYNVFAGQCSETTLMLVELQKFIAEAYSVK
jgi:hypothetical protein